MDLTKTFIPSEQLKIASDFAMPLEAVVRTMGILAQKGAGKALALDTVLATPNGWTTMKDVQVDDYLFDEQGCPTRVTFVTDIQYGHKCYLVRFSDGSEIVADADHVWLSNTYASRQADCGQRYYHNRGRINRPQCIRRSVPKLLTTQQLKDSLFVYEGTKRQARNHAIQNANKLQLGDVSLPIDPYVLGVWLGDGTSVNAHITTMDHEVLEEIQKAGYITRLVPSAKGNGKASTYTVTSVTDKPSLHRSLMQTGLLKNKHVPPIYLRGSSDQRLALLQGLMDTDGTISNRSNSCMFSNKNKQIVDSADELVVSLGWISNRTQKQSKLNGKDCGISYQLSFRPTESVFRIERKNKRFNPNVSQIPRCKQRFIVSIDETESVPVKCIQVESESHLYLAGRGMVPTHNTYTAMVIAEEMMHAGQPVIIFDPLGSWFGLSSSADGTAAGFPIVIFGGEHAHVPIQEDMGEAVARLIISQRFSAILDVSEMLDSEQRRFLTAFATTLYRVNRQSIHFFVDEADLVVPQRPMKGQEHLLHAFNNLVRRGRFHGIGVTLISQRASVINKDVLNMIDTLVVLRTIAPRDRATVKEWIEAKSTTEERKEFIESLPSLKTGEAWVWSPEFMKCFELVHIRQRETFDSSATPQVGQALEAPQTSAEVNIAGILEALSIEPVPQDTEKAVLLQQVHDLQVQLAQKPLYIETIDPNAERIINEAAAQFHENLEAALEALKRCLMTLTDPSSLVADQNIDLRPTLQSYQWVVEDGSRVLEGTFEDSGLIKVHSEEWADFAHAPEEIHLTPAVRHVLEIIGMYFPNPVSRYQVAILAPLVPSGGTFNGYISELHSKGLIVKQGSKVGLTPVGRLLAEPLQPKPRPAEVLASWQSKFTPAVYGILTLLAEFYPQYMNRIDLAIARHLTPSGGTFSGYLSELRTSGVIDEADRTRLRIHPAFFLEAN